MKGWGIGEGWVPLVEETDRLLRAIDPDYKIIQVKEKFGGLRFYYSSALDGPLMRGIVRHAEQASVRTCEKCSQPGRERISPTGWCVTLCDEHCEPTWHNADQEEDHLD